MRGLTNREYWNLMSMSHTLDDDYKHSIQKEYEKDPVSGNRHNTKNDSEKSTEEEKK